LRATEHDIDSARPHQKLKRQRIAVAVGALRIRENREWKPKDVSRKIEAMGCVLVRRGARYDWYRNPSPD